MHGNFFNGSLNMHTFFDSLDTILIESYKLIKCHHLASCLQINFYPILIFLTLENFCSHYPYPAPLKKTETVLECDGMVIYSTVKRIFLVII